MIRAFVGVEIPDDVRSVLVRAQTRLRKARARVGWVPPDNLHVTLAFLGDVEEARAMDLAAGLDRAVADCEAFEATLAGMGYFGAPRSPRVIWAGVTNDGGAFEKLYARVATVLRELGIPSEDRPFVAHVTLGRVRSARGADALVSALAAEQAREWGRFPVRSVSFMQSTLRPEGPVYTRLHESPLRGARGSKAEAAP